MSRQEIIFAIQQYFKDKPVNKVYLFGSFARGEANFNDLDVLVDVDYSKKISYFDIVRMKMSLENITHHKVDLLTTGALTNSRLLKYIKNDLSLILENARG